jgi:hypothetical protein
MSQIFLITDYRGQFWSSAMNARSRCSMNVDRLVERFAVLGHELVVKRAADAAACISAFRGHPVVYTSAEDRADQYRGFLEDLVLGLTIAGAVLVPRFELLRAHHNKVFAELYRQLMMGTMEGEIRAKVYDVPQSVTEPPFSLPVVVKGFSGAGSKAVRLARDPREFVRIAKSTAFCRDLLFTLAEWRRRFVWWRHGYVPSTLYRRRFLVQEFVPGMTEDHKVLVYGQKYYVVRRLNRPGDFRASGSGRFEFAPEDTDLRMLDFARAVYEKFDVPLLSLDIGFDGRQYRLIEYQGVHFGPAALERSTCYFRHRVSGWERITEEPDLEREFATSISDYLQKVTTPSQCPECPPGR